MPDEFAQYRLGVADLRMCNDDDREIFERNGMDLAFSQFNDELLPFDSQPGRGFGDFENAIAHGLPLRHD